jgi:hypothetical protein
MKSIKVGTKVRIKPDPTNDFLTTYFEDWR